MELPSNGRRFKVKVPAASKEPQLTVPLLIELLRRADNQRLGEMDIMRQRQRDAVHKAVERAQTDAAQYSMPYDLKKRLELLERVEKAIGLPLTQYRGFRNEPDSITPEELAVLLADAGDHVAGQRRAEDAGRLKDSMIRQARQHLTELERLEEPG
jgi:hypothetical protein